MKIPKSYLIFSPNYPSLTILILKKLAHNTFKQDFSTKNYFKKTTLFIFEDKPDLSNVSYNW